MGYIATWKVLEEALTHLRKKGISVPAEIMNDLKNAKTTIQILKADPSRIETTRKIDEYLRKLESYIISKGEKALGAKYVDTFLLGVDEARRVSDEEEKETTFVPGMPRQRNWIRVTSSDVLPLERLKKLAEESNLAFTEQKDGYILVEGEDKKIKDFVKKMATEYGTKSAKYR